MDKAFGLLLQYPDDRGEITDLRPIIEKAHAAGLLVAVATDLLALTLLTPPGEMGADVVVGNSQRFGVPLGYGGPHAAFFATREALHPPGAGPNHRPVGRRPRAPGVSDGAPDARAAHPAREGDVEHLHRAGAPREHRGDVCRVPRAEGAARDRASACTARRVRWTTRSRRWDIARSNAAYFDTLRIEGADVAGVRIEAEAAGLNFRYDGAAIGISVDETTTREDIVEIVAAFAAARKLKGTAVIKADAPFALKAPAALARTSAYLTHPVFNSYHSETKMMRYIRSLEKKDVGLDTSMIPLGSCTMKLNAASEMIPVSWPEFASLHPFAPREQARGYTQIFEELEAALCRITGFAAVSLQPNSGAQGEFTGLMTIRAYHRDRGHVRRNVVLIPSSAHGTNPASATMAGLKVVVVACDSKGNVELSDLRAKAQQHKDALAALMVTYPSTHGVFEEEIKEICAIVHEHGGQVYMDGANMNAQVGLTSPAAIGADVCHLNLHKTFAIPHGGGGPGMGPIAVAKHLVPYLPGHPVVQVGGDKAIPAVAAAPWGSASILIISYGYIRMLGANGMTEATRYAILNANYIKARLQGHYDVLYANHNGRVAHEMIFDLRPFKHGVEPGGRVRRREAADGLRVPRADRLVPGGGDDDDRADRERAEGRARPVLRCADLDSPGDPGHRGREGGSRRTTC